MVKSEIVGRLARTRRVVLVVDDDADVCAALSGAGFGVFRATWANPDPDLSRMLHEAQHDEGRT